MIIKINFSSFLKTIRGKITLWYMGSVTFLLFLLAGVFIFAFWFTINSQIDHHIHIAVNEAKQIVESYPPHQRVKMLENLVSAQGMTIVLLSPDGTPLLQTNSPDVATISEHQMQQVIISTKDNSTNEISSPSHFTVNEIRFATLPIIDSGGQNIVAVGYSKALITNALHKMLMTIFSIVALSLLVFSIVGFKLLKKYFTPLEEIAVSASTVSSTQDLNKRLPETTQSSELKNIVTAFNQMLSKLQQVFATEHEFFSNTAHTLKTPLAVLRANIETLDNESTKTKKNLLNLVDHSIEIIQDLLLISRLQTSTPPKTAKFSLSDLVIDLVELATLLGTEKKLKIESNIQDNISVRANKSLLSRAVGNVIKNAVEHSKQNGKITLKLEIRRKNKVVLFIKDTGYGIPKKDLSRVFDRFYQSKTMQNSFIARNLIQTKNSSLRKKSGSGLGLAITKAVIESISGKTEIKSQINKGTTVVITLPVNRLPAK